jgi:hypothetical protein
MEMLGDNGESSLWKGSHLNHDLSLDKFQVKSKTITQKEDIRRNLNSQSFSTQKKEKVGTGKKRSLNFYQSELKEFQDTHEMERSSESNKNDQFPVLPPDFVIDG